MVYAKQGCQLLLFPGVLFDVFSALLQAAAAIFRCVFYVFPQGSVKISEEKEIKIVKTDNTENFFCIAKFAPVHTAAFSMTTCPVQWELLARARRRQTRNFVFKYDS